MNGYSLIYVVLYVFALKPRLGNILYKVTISKGKIRVWQTMVGTSKLENTIFFLPCKSEHPHPDCGKLSSSSARLRKQLSGRRSRTELTCNHFKEPQVQFENLIMYQITHPLHHLTQLSFFIFDIVKRSTFHIIANL